MFNIITHMNKVTLIENPETKENKENRSNLNYQKTKTGRINKTKQDIQVKKTFEVSKITEQNLDKSKNVTERKKLATSTLAKKETIPGQVKIDTPQAVEKTKPKDIDYITKENDKLIKYYGSDIFEYAKELDNVDIPNNFMAKHSIDPDIRIKMVDWMVEVLSVYKSEEETFFLAVRLMDMFIYKSTGVINTSEIHLLGIVCMFIASKFEDIFPIRIDSVESKIGHNLFSA